ncbi:MAG: hypothetical protein LBQ21_04785 [Clostridiales Family XIII bacterium]|jgi:hypothetical protein|nr:hypothetical protein [Clostridiales Family XIII bacterium]
MEIRRKLKRPAAMLLSLLLVITFIPAPAVADEDGIADGRAQTENNSTGEIDADESGASKGVIGERAAAEEAQEAAPSTTDANTQTEAALGADINPLNEQPVQPLAVKLDVPEYLEPNWNAALQNTDLSGATAATLNVPIDFANYKWRVIGGNINQTTVGVYTTAENSLTLVADTLHDWGKDKIYENANYIYSGVKSKMEAIFNNELNKNTNINARDLDDINGTAVTGAKLWPLSLNEYNSMNVANRAYRADYWLRSSIGNSYFYVGKQAGGASSYSYVTSELGVRPALSVKIIDPSLNLASDIFTSDVTAGSGFSAASATKVFTKRNITVMDDADTTTLPTTWAFSVDPTMSNDQARRLSFTVKPTNYSDRDPAADEYLAVRLVNTVTKAQYYAKVAAGSGFETAASIPMRDVPVGTYDLYICAERENASGTSTVVGGIHKYEDGGSPLTVTADSLNPSITNDSVIRGITTADVAFKSDEDVEVYYAYDVSGGAVYDSVNQLTSRGAYIPLYDPAGATTNSSIRLTGLDASLSYKLYITVKDYGGNYSTPISIVDIPAHPLAHELSDDLIPNWRSALQNTNLSGATAATLNVPIDFAGYRWRVIGGNINQTTVGVYTTAENSLTLAADTEGADEWGTSYFHPTNNSGDTNYENSYLRNTIMKNIYETNLSSNESINARVLDGITGTVNDAKVWPLSKTEYDSMSAANRAYGKTDYYWLRTANGSYRSYVGARVGSNAGNYDVNNPYGVRPAVSVKITDPTLELASDDIFTSDATAGSGFSAVSASRVFRPTVVVMDEDEEVVTLPRAWNVTDTPTVDDGKIRTLNLSVAPIGYAGDDPIASEYLAVRLVDPETKAQYYAKVATGGTWATEASIPIYDIPSGNYDMYICAERTESGKDVVGTLTKYSGKVSVPADTYPPALTNGTVARGITTATAIFASDEEGQIRYEYSVSGGAVYADVNDLTQQGADIPRLDLSESTTNGSISLTGLEGNRAYKLYVTVKDPGGNYPTPAPIYTLDIPAYDDALPVVSEISATRIGINEATLSFTYADAPYGVNGKYYYVVVPSGTALTTVDDVKNYTSEPDFDHGIGGSFGSSMSGTARIGSNSNIWIYSYQIPDQTLYLVVEDEVGNASADSPYALPLPQYDTDKPTFTTYSAVRTAADTATVRFTPNEYISYRCLVDENPTASAVSITAYGGYAYGGSQKEHSVSGLASATAAYYAHIVMTDSSENVSDVADILIEPWQTAPTITTDTELPSIILGETASAITYEIEATGKPMAFDWSIADGNWQPSGLTLGAVAGESTYLTGTALKVGDYTFPITATNGVSPDATTSFTLRVNNPTPEISDGKVVSRTGATAAIVSFKFDENAAGDSSGATQTYYYVVSADSAPPSAADIVTGSNTVLGGTGSAINGADNEIRLTSAQLTQLTQYVHVFVRDTDAQQDTDSNIVTVALGKVPVPAKIGDGVRTSETTAEITFKCNEAGIYYYYVTTAGLTEAPTVGDIKSNKTGFGMIVTADAPVTVGGIDVGADAKDIYVVVEDNDDPQELCETPIVFAIPAYTDTVYRVLSHFGKWTGTGPVIARIDADYDKFIDLYYDGVRIDRSNYTLAEGSTIITLPERYLKAFPGGKHIFTAAFSDGYSADIVLEIDLTAAAKTPANSAANTGDDFDLGRSVMMLLIAIAGLGICAAIRRRSEKYCGMVWK